MDNKLEREDFYHQFHGLQHHKDSSESDMSLLDAIHPHHLYKNGGAVNLKTLAGHGRHSSVVDHALSLTRHTALHGMQQKRGRP